MGKCPKTLDVAHGQCVRANASKVSLRHTGLWKLHTACGVECWKQKSDVSVHFVRLAFADHLDIPFQEVGDVLLRRTRKAAAESRRLSDTQNDAQKVVSEAFLEISVSSRRHTAETGSSRMKTFFSSAAEASQLLGLAVRSLEWLEGSAVERAHKEMSDEAAPGEEGDLYAPFYEELAPPSDGHMVMADDEDSGATIAGVPLDGVPGIAIISGGSGLLLIVVVLAVCCRVRKWRRLYNQQVTIQGRVVQQAVKTGNDDDEDDNQKPPQFSRQDPEAPAEENARTSEECGDLCNGDKASVDGLEKQPHLNGLLVELLHWDGAKCRWNVKMPDGREVAMKPTNLIKCEAKDPSTPRGAGVEEFDVDEEAHNVQEIRSSNGPKSRQPVSNVRSL